MALSVQLNGFGLCQTIRPYSVMVICVQQESFQAWTVYRRYSSFVALNEQLRAFTTESYILPPLPTFDAENLSLENLESCRYALDNWLREVTSNLMILRTQSMYQFLCVEANEPPPFLEIHWKNRGSNQSFDEMDMDDMFEKQEEDYGDGEEWEDEVDDSMGAGISSWEYGQTSHQTKVNKNFKRGNNSRNNKPPRPHLASAESCIDEEDEVMIYLLALFFLTVKRIDRNSECV
jgi:hypothetical protein